MSSGERFLPEHLQALRDRIRLSELIGRTVALKREGREHVGLCPFHEEKTPSFSVNDSKGIWRCFGCHKGGDCIDFTRLAFRMSFKEAVEALTSQHGLSAAAPVIDPATARRAEDRRRREEDRARHYLDAARRIWADAIPAENSPVERYLRSRSITDPIPASIRYHPELVYRLDQKTRIILPGMVAQVCNCAGEMIGLHRTFIKRDGLGKADVPKVKLMLGDARGGAVFFGVNHRPGN